MAADLSASLRVEGRRGRPAFGAAFAIWYDGHMAATQKVTVNLPVEALTRARKLTGKGTTATLVEALEALEQQAKRSALRRLRGKVKFTLDLAQARR
jgi:hypothetical protein